MISYKIKDIYSVNKYVDGVIHSNCLLHDGNYLNWMGLGNTPLPADPVPNPAIAAIDAQLSDIDFRSIRPVRECDTVFLATLTAQAIELRTARALLPKMV